MKQSGLVIGDTGRCVIVLVFESFSGSGIGLESRIFVCADKQHVIRYHPKSLRGYVVTVGHGLSVYAVFSRRELPHV